MADLSCPQCGNPQLDVDAQNDVVFCRRCGFAVRVDPQTGEATPLSTGGPAAGGPPAAYSHTLFGTDALTALLGGTIVLLILTLFLNLGLFIFGVLEAILLYLYWRAR